MALDLNNSLVVGTIFAGSVAALAKSIPDIIVAWRQPRQHAENKALLATIDAKQDALEVKTDAIKTQTDGYVDGLLARISTLEGENGELRAELRGMRTARAPHRSTDVPGVH